MASDEKEDEKCMGKCLTPIAGRANDKRTILIAISAVMVGIGVLFTAALPAVRLMPESETIKNLELDMNLLFILSGVGLMLIFMGIIGFRIACMAAIYLIKVDLEKAEIHGESAEENETKDNRITQIENPEKKPL